MDEETELEVREYVREESEEVRLLQKVPGAGAAGDAYANAVVGIACNALLQELAA